MRLSTFVCIALTAIFIGLAIYIQLVQTSALPYGHREEPTPFAESIPASSNEESLEALRIQHESLVDAALAASKSAMPMERTSDSTKVHLTDTTDDGWPHPYKRTRFDVHSYFITGAGHIRVGQLVRHIDLNKHDIYVKPDLIAELEIIIDHYNSLLGPITQNYHATRSREMISAIESKSVSPADLSPIDQKRADDRAQRASGQAREAVQIQPSSRESHIVHQGRLYLLSSFSELPVSASMYEALEFFGGEFLAHVVKWFESYGYISSRDAAAILARTFQSVPTKRK